MTSLTPSAPVRLCLQCGREVHEPSPCFDVALVRSVFPFPNSVRELAGGRSVRLRSSCRLPWQDLTLASLGSATLAATLSSLLSTGQAWAGLGVGAATGLFALGTDASILTEAFPGALRLVRPAPHQPAMSQLGVGELRELEVRSGGGRFQVIAHDCYGYEYVIADGLRGKRGSDMLADAVWRVLRLAPFSGTRPVELPSATAPAPSAEVVVGWGPTVVRARADRDGLYLTPRHRAEVRLDSDELADLTVTQHLRDATVPPLYQLELTLRRGGARTLFSTPEPLPLIAFASSTRALWRIGPPREAKSLEESFETESEPPDPEGPPLSP